MHPNAEVIASWPAPNFVNPPTRGSALTVVNIIFIILVFLTAGARFYTRLRITRSFGLDDWMIGLSLVCCISQKRYILQEQVVDTISVTDGAGESSALIFDDRFPRLH